jgi:hypothetical protein
MSDDTTQTHNDEQHADLNAQLDEKAAEQADHAPVSGDDVVAKLMAQNEDLTNKWKRAVADYQNLEKQVKREKAEFMSFASAQVMERFLPILDHMDQAVSGMSDEEKKSGWAGTRYGCIYPRVFLYQPRRTHRKLFPVLLFLLFLLFGGWYQDQLEIHLQVLRLPFLRLRLFWLCLLVHARIQLGVRDFVN